MFSGTRLFRPLAAVCVTAPLLLLTPATPAQGDDGTTTRTRLLSSTDFAPGGIRELVTVRLSLVAGESRHIAARLEATSSMTQNADMGNIVQCAIGSAQQGIASYTGRNHEGHDATHYAVDGHLPIYSDLLFTAPTTAVYTCGLYGYTASQASSSYRLTAVAGNTWIEVSDADQAGSHWWQNPDCASNGSGSCTYLGGPGDPTSSYVFYNDGTTPIHKWAAAPDATAVDVVANVQMTTCYGTSTCTHRGSSANSVVSSYLELVQLDTTLHTCVSTKSPPVRSTITNAAHHYVGRYTLSNVPISSTCGTRLFYVRVHVSYVSGNPVKIDGTRPAQHRSMTHAIAMNKFR